MDPIGFAASIGSQLLSNYNQQVLNKDNLSWAEQQSNIQYQRQRDLISEQRQYDSPVAQMHRLVEAGLNPNLIYGDLSGGMSAASVPGNVPVPNQSLPGFNMDPLALSQMRLNDAQAENLKAAASKSEADVRLTDAKIKEIFGETPVSQATIDNLKATAESSRANAQATLESIEKMKSEIALMNTQQRSQYLQNLFDEKTFAYRVSILDSQMKIDAATADSIQQTINATIAQLLGASEASYASARLSDAQVKVQDALVDYYKSLGDKAAADAAYVRLQHVLLDTFGDEVQASTILRNIAFTYDESTERGRVSHPKFHTTDKNRIIEAHPRKPYNSYSSTPNR